MGTGTVAGGGCCGLEISFGVVTAVVLLLELEKIH